MLSKEETKKMAATRALEYIQPGMTVGIGTGSTVYWLIQELAKMVKNGWHGRGVPTSKATHVLAASLGIPMVELNDVDKIDITIDGADEIDHRLNLIKGGGGALLQEKMVAAASDRLIIIADSSKYVQQLGAFPLPVEVIPYGWKQVQKHIRDRYSVNTELRMKNDAPFLTDHGHYILDCYFQQIADPPGLTIALDTVPGVVDNGLFVGMTNAAIIAWPDGTVKQLS